MISEAEACLDTVGAFRRHPMTVRAIAVSTALLTALSAATFAYGQSETVITVTNGGNAINGDTTNIASLIATPGPDGISFAEAIQAANGTPGPKLLKFAPELSRNPIELLPDGVDRRFIPLLSGSLTIDGDVDGDHKPDITLVGRSSAASTAFVIRSSRNTIRGLNLQTFPDAAIIFTCLDQFCEDRTIQSTRIENNTFFSPQGSGISVAPSGVRPADTPYVTDVGIDGLVITGNDFTVRDTGILLIPGYGGLQHTSARNVTISNNRIAAATGIEVAAGGQSAQPFYSDFNLIDGLTIDNNKFEDNVTAISIVASDWSGSFNTVHATRVTKNQFSGAKTAVMIATAANGIPQRLAEHNSIDDLAITGNTFLENETAIAVSGSGVPDTAMTAVGFNSNTMTALTIDNNTITDYRLAAIRIRGAFISEAFGSAAATGNSIEGVVITNNVLQALQNTSPVGVSLIGGDAVSGGTAQRNSIRNVTLSGNRVQGPGVSLQLIGGNGSQAKANTLDFPHLGANAWQSTVPLTMADDANGASGNSILGAMVRRRAVGKP